MSETAQKATALVESSHQRRAILFVAGQERNSIAAKANLKRICESDPQRKVEFEVIDVLVDHRKALEFKVLLTPALLIFDAGRSARITGSLDESSRVAAALGMNPGA